MCSFIFTLRRDASSFRTSEQRFFVEDSEHPGLALNEKNITLFPTAYKKKHFKISGYIIIYMHLYMCVYLQLRVYLYTYIYTEKANTILCLQ